MILSDIMKNPVLQTKGIAADADPAYLKQCLDLFFSGQYGEIPAEDTEANNMELESGEGRILARYKKAGRLKEDIYIIAHFSKSNPDMEANHTIILYRSEY